MQFIPHGPHGPLEPNGFHGQSDTSNKLALEQGRDIPSVPHLARDKVKHVACPRTAKGHVIHFQLIIIPEHQTS